MLIIKQTKALRTVVQDKSEYRAEAMKHLNDQTTYKPLRENIRHILKDLINNKLKLLLKTASSESHGIYFENHLPNTEPQNYTPKENPQ